jgi:hypothetical protein
VLPLNGLIKLSANASMHVHRASINILSSFDFFAFSIQLENPRSYSNLENYYNKFRICKRKNNWLHSPQNILGVEDLPFLKVSVKCTLLYYPTLSKCQTILLVKGRALRINGLLKISITDNTSSRLFFSVS